MVFRVTKPLRELVQVDGLLGERVTGFVSDQDVVNPGFVGVSSGVGRAQFGVPCVDGRETMLGEESSKKAGVRMSWPWSSTLSVLKVAKPNTARNPIEAGVQVTP